MFVFKYRRRPRTKFEITSFVILTTYTCTICLHNINLQWKWLSYIITKQIPVIPRSWIDHNGLHRQYYNQHRERDDGRKTTHIWRFPRKTTIPDLKWLLYYATQFAVSDTSNIYQLDDVSKTGQVELSKRYETTRSQRRWCRKL